MKDDVKKWIKTLSRKGAPFYVMRKEEITYKVSSYNENREWVSEDRTGFRYYLIWKDKTNDKVKVGWLQDGMTARYGIQTYATLTGTEVTGFWQLSTGIMTPDDMEHMTDFAKGERYLTEFSFDLLKDVTH